MAAQPQEEHAEEVGIRTTEPAQQALRREVNEQISSLNYDLGISGDDGMKVLCECVHANCTGRIEMTVSDYETVRRFPTRFFVKAGHELAEAERIVTESDGYVVIETTGSSGLRAVASDPRRRTNRLLRHD
jgi:hypothetical protein